MDDPTTLAAVWLAVAITFAGAEIMIAGSFFLLPFAGGAVAASIASAFGLIFPASLAIFIIVSFVAFLALRPLAKRLATTGSATKGIGANRLIGTTGTITETVSADPSHVGRVKLGTEDWIANSDGEYLRAGTEVTVLEIRGTQAIVEAV